MNVQNKPAYCIELNEPEAKKLVAVLEGYDAGPNRGLALFVDELHTELLEFM